MRLRLLAIFIPLYFGPQAPGTAAAQTKAAAALESQATEIPDTEIVQRLIAQSAASYPGKCRCPGDHDSRGRRCGGRSAHSRAGGVKPICSEEDVGPETIEKERKAMAVSSR